MGGLGQFTEKLRQPVYRVKLAFFLILGFATTLASIQLQSRSPFWSEVLKDFAVTLSAVGLLQLLWDFLGGDPLGRRVEELGQSITLLSDLTEGNIGLERIWKDRRSWDKDPVDGRETWYARVCEAKHVDIASNTLWNNWIKEPEFRDRLFESLGQGTRVRILVYDPDSDVLQLRAKDEKDTFEEVQGSKVYEMQLEIKRTLREIAAKRRALPELARMKGGLEVRLTDKALHLAQIVRADEAMIVAIYLSGRSGSWSPTMQLRGADSSLFQSYADQFNTIWERGRALDDADFDRILEETEGTRPAPSDAV